MRFDCVRLWKSAKKKKYTNDRIIFFEVKETSRGSSGVKETARGD